MPIFIDFGISIMVKLRDKYFRKRQEDVEQLFWRKQVLPGWFLSLASVAAEWDWWMFEFPFLSGHQLRSLPLFQDEASCYDVAAMFVCEQMS